ncbi:hypothetical protein EDB85DRAFT_2074429 [Lactarius pseudohatsudake]|nr:hypothetical protein EDB85DRAFT_2074429 [Lactarius pseudohatsudake]
MADVRVLSLLFVAFSWMVYIPIEVSSETPPNYDLYRHRLANRWLPGSEVDNCDGQYHSFRTNLPALAALMAAFSPLKYVYTRPILRDSSPTNNLHRIPFYLIFTLLMLTVLHDASIIKLAVPVTWLFNDGVLLANEWYGGYAFASLHSWHGVYPRWHVSFNITMLRLVSFSIDYHWACNHIGITDVRYVCLLVSSAAVFHLCATYTFGNHLVYALYAPLYIAGPIFTFNDFMWQPLPTSVCDLALAAKRDRAAGNGRYAVRFVIALPHDGNHFVAIKDAHAWIGMTPAQLSMVGFWDNLIFVAYLLLPWRFFRLWALADGLGPSRRTCLLPARRPAATSILVFTFVALCHDLSPRLSAWGWLAALFILPEVAARKSFPPGGTRHACAAGGMCNVLPMMGANLVGFVPGIDGAQYFARIDTSCIRFLFGACACLFVGVQLMFEYREEELRRGIQR